MKKKTEQLLNGKFEYEQPHLLFSKEKISLTLKAGETRRGEVYLGTEDNCRIRGYVTSSSRRLVPGLDKFTGTTVCLPYGIDAVGMEPGQDLEGWICFTTNIGEYRLGFEIHVEKEELKTAKGTVSDLEEFCQIAKKDFREAFRIFTDPSFSSLLKNEEDQKKALFAGLSRQPVTYQHLEEFLIGIGMKEQVSVSLKDPGARYYEVKQDMQEAFYIHRSGWGHLRLEIEAYGDFLEIPKKVVTDEDFIGSYYEVDYLISCGKLGAGNQFGKIVVKSPYQQLTYELLVSRTPKVEVNVRVVEEQHKLAILKDYLDFRCNKMDASTWAASTHYELNQLRENGCDYPEYQMYEAFLLHQEGNDEGAVQILEKYQDKAFTKDDLEFAGFYLYLCVETGIYRDQEQALRKLRNFHMQKEDSFTLLWVLLRKDPELCQSSSKAIFMMEELYEKGCKSPFLYLEAWKLVSRNISLLHRLNGFWVQVFLFAAKRDLLTQELAMRIAYLSGYEKNYNESLYRVLAKGYEYFPSEDTLEAVCKYIIKGDPRKPEYFIWYSRAVQQGLRITRLYEYYVETMDMAGQQELPKPLLMYFTYNNDTLGDNKKAFIYSRVIADKEADPANYQSYQKSMAVFAKKKLSEGCMNEHYAAIYQEFLTDPKTKEEANAIAGRMFTYRLFCDDKKIRSVIVKHSQMAEEEVYPCVQGVAYPRIYTEDAVILFQDEQQRRYASTVGYNLKKMLDEEEMMPKVLAFGVEETGVLLHYCMEHPISRDDLELFQKLAGLPGVSSDYRGGIRKEILDYYAGHIHGEDLDGYLKRLDCREYALVDRETLLSVLISRGLFPQAAAIVEEFGFEGLDMKSLLKLVSRMIIRCEMAEDEELLALASEVYRSGIYDEVILQYLMKYRFGPMDEMFSIWKSAKGFEMDTYDMEEKLLGLLIFTSDYRKEGESILADYIKHKGKERLIGAYLTQVAYGIFVKEFSMSSLVKKSLKKAYLEKWPVDLICHLALFKELVREKGKSEEILSMERELLKECMDRNMEFAFFHKLSAELLSPYQLDDKTYVEFHGSPKWKVTLFYALDTGLGAEPEYKNEPLYDIYEGIRTKSFTLFYGETLHYYFQSEYKGKIKKTAERTMTMSRVEGAPGSKYQMINQILSARRLDKDAEVAAKLKQYLRQEQYVNEMFVIRKED